MRLSVFSPEASPQLFIDLKKIYKGYLSDQQLTTESLQALLAKPNTQFFVTLFNARHLGAVEVKIDANNAQLSLLCIRDLTRRRGVGKNLLREVEKKLKNDGVNCVELSLDQIKENEQNVMEAFMLSCGYQLNQQRLSKQLA